EFIGTYILASVYLAIAGRTAFPFYVSIAAGMTMGLMVLVIGATSGAHINPAVTVGQWTLRRIDTLKAVAYIVAQMLGGLAAWKMNEYLIGSNLKNIAGTGSDWRVFVAEALGTFVFTFGIAAAVYQGHKGLKRAVTIGGSLALGILVATFASNGLLNPAVALGMRSWSFAYVTAPILGSVVGMNLYLILFSPLGITTTKHFRPKHAKSRVTISKSKASASRRKK
ncbi:MAG: aquaporin, partial [Candidatus Saccharimonadales bacterium]